MCVIIILRGDWLYLCWRSKLIISRNELLVLFCGLFCRRAVSNLHPPTRRFRSRRNISCSADFRVYIAVRKIYSYVLAFTRACTAYMLLFLDAFSETVLPVLSVSRRVLFCEWRPANDVCARELWVGARTRALIRDISRTQNRIIILYTYRRAE